MDFGFWATFFLLSRSAATWSGYEYSTFLSPFTIRPTVYTFAPARSSNIWAFLNLFAGTMSSIPNPILKVQHLLLGNVTQLLQVLKDRLHRPGAEPDDSSGAAGENARQVFCNAPAGDVSQTGDAVGINDFL